MTATVRRGPGRPAGAQPGASRAALVRAARSCFAEKGYAAATTRDICERAGTQQANLRHHLGSKAEAFAAVYDDCMQQVRAALDESIELAQDGTPGEHLRALGTLVRDAPDVVGFLVVAPLERRRHEELRTALGDAPVALEELVRGTVRSWSTSGRLAGGIDPDVLSDVLIGAVFGTVLYGMHVDPQVDLDATVDVLARLVDGQVFD